MSDATPLSIVLELARARDVDDPFAFEFEDQDYTLRTAGGGRERVHVAWRQGLLEDVEAARLPGRDPAVLARLGEALRKILQPAGWGGQARKILEADRRVIVTLRCAAAELYCLPWELTALGRGGPHLGSLGHVLLRYEWPETRTAAAPRAEGGRILFAWSAAGGAVPARDHQQAIVAACGSSVAFDPLRDVLPHASIDRLVATLEEAPPAILHLLCHGGMAGSTFGLVLDGDGPVTVDAGRLRQVLAPFADRLQLVVLAACDGGNPGAPGNYLGSVAQSLHRAGIPAVVSSRYPLSVPGSTRLTQALYQALADTASVEAGLLAARARLAEDPEHLDWASVQLHARAADGPEHRPLVFRPYRGLLAFQPDHTRFFFGRDTERREVVTRLAELRAAGRPRFVVVAGASGTGKSSVVLAGAVPDLLGTTPLVGAAADAVREGVDALERVLGAVDLPAVRQSLATLRTALPQVAQADRWRLAVLRPGARPEADLQTALDDYAPGHPLLLVVDQFEEVFTHVEAAARDRFVRRLWALAKGPDPIAVVITIRVDFLGQCGDVVVEDSGLRLDRVAYDEAHRVFVAQMGPEQLRAAIVEPARRVGLRLEEGLADRILAEVGAEPGALPLLQYTLDMLWVRRTDGALINAAYEALGGVGGALEGHADAIADAMSPAQLREARRMLVRLVGRSAGGARDARRRVVLAGLRPPDPIRAECFDGVVERLIDARLLFRAGEGEEATLEVAHEALIRRWRRLHGWVDEDLEKLVQLDAVERWVAQFREYGTVLDGDQLGYAHQVAARYPDDLSPDLVRMIAESDAAAQRRRRRRLAGLAAVLAAGIGLAIWQSAAADHARALQEKAEDATQVARKKGVEAERAATAAKAAAARARDAALLARAQAQPDAVGQLDLLRQIQNPGDLRGYFGAVAAALLAPEPPAMDLDAIVVSRCIAGGLPRKCPPDAPLRFLGTDDRVRDLRGGPASPRLRMAEVGVHDRLRLAFTADAEWVVRAGEFRWSAQSGGLPDDDIPADVASRDGRWVARGSDDGVVFKRQGGGPGFTVAGADPTLIRFIVGADRALVQVGLNASELDLTAGKALRSWPVQAGASAGGFGAAGPGYWTSPDHTQWAYWTDKDEVVVVGDGTEATVRPPYPGHAGRSGVGFAPANGRIALAHTDGRSNVPIEDPMLHEAPPPLAAPHDRGLGVWTRRGDRFERTRMLRSDKSITAPRFSPSGALVVAGGQAWRTTGYRPQARIARSGQVWSSAEGRRLLIEPPFEPAIDWRASGVTALGLEERGLAVSWIGDRLATADRGIRVYVEPDSPPVELPGHATAGSFSRDGRRLATVGPDGGQVWEIASKKLLLSTEPGEYRNWEKVALSADGRRVAVMNGLYHWIEVWDVDATKRILEVPPRGSELVVGIAAHALDGKGERLAVLYEDTLVVWDVDGGESRSVPHGVTSVAPWMMSFRPDGLVLATSRAISFWDLEALEPNTRWVLPTGVRVVGLAPGARHVVLAEPVAQGVETQRATVVPLDLDQLRTRMWCHSPQCLTPAMLADRAGMAPDEALDHAEACLRGVLSRADACELPELVRIRTETLLRELRDPPPPRPDAVLGAPAP